MTSYLVHIRLLTALFLLVAIFIPVGLMGQDDALADDSLPCRPDGIEPPIAKYQEENIGQEQVSIYYDYAREYYKIATTGSLPGNIESATEYYWRVILNDEVGRFKVAYTKLADCYLRNQSSDSALNVVYMGLDKYPDYDALHYTAGKIYKVLDQAECAAPHYEALANLSAADSETQLNYLSILAKLYFEMEDERCITTQKKVVELDPESLEAATLLVKMMGFFGHETLHVLRDAYLKDPQNLANARAYGQATFEAGQYKQSSSVYITLIKNQPEDVHALRYLARSYEELENFSEAVDAYRRILDIEPKNLNALVSLASVYSDMKNFSTARAYVRKAKSIDPDYGWAYMVMGELYENAVTHCSDSREKRGYTYDDKLVYEMARAEYRKAASRDRNVQRAAEKRVKELEPFVRTDEDRFMYGRDSTTDDCYSWIE